MIRIFNYFLIILIFLINHSAYAKDLLITNAKLVIDEKTFKENLVYTEETAN